VNFALLFYSVKYEGKFRLGIGLGFAYGAHSECVSPRLTINFGNILQQSPFSELLHVYRGAEKHCGSKNQSYQHR